MKLLIELLELTEKLTKNSVQKNKRAKLKVKAVKEEIINEANWQLTLDIKDDWDKTSDGKMEVEELSKIIAKKLKALEPKVKSLGDVDTDFHDLVDMFEYFSGDDKDEFDGMMSELYDWGDQKLDDKWNGKKVCWIKTF